MDKKRLCLKPTMDDNQPPRNAATAGAETPGGLAADLAPVTWTMLERESISNQQLLLHPGLMMAPMQHHIQPPEVLPPALYPFQPSVLPQFSAPPLMNPAAPPCVQQTSAHNDNVLIRPNEFIVAEFNQAFHPLTVSFHSPCYPGLFPWQSGEPVGMQLYQMTRSSKEKQEEIDVRQENNCDNKTTIPQIHENVDANNNGDKEDGDGDGDQTPETPESSSPWEYLDKLFATDDFLRNLELKQIAEETQLDSPVCSEPETHEVLPHTEPEEQLESTQTTEIIPPDDADCPDPEPYDFLPPTDPEEQLFDETRREQSLEKDEEDGGNVRPDNATCQQLSDGTTEEEEEEEEEEVETAEMRNDRALEKDLNFFTRLETALAAFTETPPEKSSRDGDDGDDERTDLTEGMVSGPWSPEVKPSTKDDVKVGRDSVEASGEAAVLGDGVEQNFPLSSPEKNCEKSPKPESPVLRPEDQRQRNGVQPTGDDRPHQEFVLDDQRPHKAERRRNKSKDGKITKPHRQEPPGGAGEPSANEAEARSEIPERPTKRKQSDEAEVDSKRAKEQTVQAREAYEDADRTVETDPDSLAAACRRSQRGRDPCEGQPPLAKRSPANGECKGERTRVKAAKGTQRGGRKRADAQGKRDDD